MTAAFEWNSTRHTTDDAVPAARRAFTQLELQTFFDAADDLVDREFAAGSKRWLPALRDSTAFKVAYAYGLRRRELAMLQGVDFGPNPHVAGYGSFGAVQVRWAKGTAGSGPRRRTVLTVPKFEWVVDLLGCWLSPAGRARFATAERSLDLWPSERSARASLRTFEHSFQTFRSLSGLPVELSMHALRHSYVTHLPEPSAAPAAGRDRSRPRPPRWPPAADPPPPPASKSPPRSPRRPLLPVDVGPGATSGRHCHVTFTRTPYRLNSSRHDIAPYQLNGTS